MRSLLSLLILASAAAAARDLTAEVAVWGSTPAGVIAAVAAARSGAATVLLDFSPRVGGVVSGGWAARTRATRPRSAATRASFVRVARRYNASADEPHFTFAPSDAEAAFLDMLASARVTRVALPAGASLARTAVAGGRVASLVASDGTAVAARVFIDASYEGDLAAAAGAAMAVGRESAAAYNESFGGRREPYGAIGGHFFP